MIEPIKSNDPLYGKTSPNLKNNELDESYYEPIQGN